MLKFIRRFLAAILVCCSAFHLSSSVARLSHGSGLSQFAKTQVNVDTPLNAFVNVLHNCSFNQSLSATSALDANGYPTASGPQYNCGSPLTASVPYVLIWPSTRGGSISLGDGNFASCTGNVNATVSGCTGSGSTTVSPTSAGQKMRLTLTPGISSLTLVTFGTGLTGSGEIALIRQSDCTRFTGTSDCSGTSLLEYLTSEFVSTYSTLNPKALRFMHVTNLGGGNLNTESKWSYHRTLNSLQWTTGQEYPPGALAPSAATGTNTYTVAGAPDTPASWTDGEVLLVNFTNSNTNTTYSAEANNGSGAIRLTVSSSTGFSTGQTVSISSNQGYNDPAYSGGPTWTVTVIDATHIDLQNSIFQSGAAGSSGTINVVPTIATTSPARSAKQIISQNGAYLIGNQLASGSVYTLIYKAVIDKVVMINGGIIAGFPYDVQIHLANLVNASYWPTIPYLASDDFVTQLTTLASSNLNSNVGFYPEYSNEVWNGGFSQSGFAVTAGIALGFPNGNGEPNLGWYGLRNRQINGNIVPAAWTGGSSRLMRVFAWQAGGDQNILNYSMKGADLVNSKAYSQAATLTCGSQTLVNSPFSGFQNGWPVKFTGALCTGMSSATTYYVSNVQDGNGTNFYLATSAGGSLLSTSGTASGVTVTYTNPFYATTINVAYNANPNRPMDVNEISAYAPYTGGTHFFYGADTGQGVNDNFLQPSTVSKSLYQSVINNWEGGNHSAAISSIDNDIFPGTSVTATVASVSGNTITTTATHGIKVGSSVIVGVSGGTTYSGLTANTYKLYYVDTVPSTTTLTMQPYTNGFPSGTQVTPGSAGTGTTTLSWVGGACNPFAPSAVCNPIPAASFGNSDAMINIVNGYMQFGEWMAAQFDGDRPAGMANVKVAWYEGSLESWPPDQTIVTSLGLTGTTPEASLQAAEIAWLNDPLAYAQQTRFFKAFMGTDPAFFTYNAMPHSYMPSHFTIYGPRSYSNSWAILSGYDGSTPYQLYNAISDYNTH